MFFKSTSAESSNDKSAFKVVILSSKNPGFFIGHADIHQFSVNNPFPSNLPQNATLISLKYFSVIRLLTYFPIIFIAEISGRTIGTGQELAIQKDMRFASRGAIFGSLEAALGDFSSASGLQ
jgi:enoyl-CoA hydratase/carnithine racemase